MIVKARIEETIYDVISYSEFKRNRDVYIRYSKNIAIDNGSGYILPIRSVTDARPGFYPGESAEKDKFILPDELHKDSFSVSNIINFSEAKNLREVIEAQDKLNKAERSILTTVDNITVPEVDENDTPFMKAIKTAIVNKHIDLDKYAYRFGNNYPNDKRLLKKDDMTLLKGISYANCLDFDIYAIIKDNSEDVPNPIGSPIVVKLTGDNAGFTNEFDDRLDEITSCDNTPMMIPNAAMSMSYAYNVYDSSCYTTYVSPTR